MTPPRAPSHVDRSELPDRQRITLLERDVQELRQDVADIVSGESVRDDRLKLDTQQSISQAATMMQVQHVRIEEQGKKLDELLASSRASAEEREKRRQRDDDTEKHEQRLAKRRRFTDLATLIGAFTGLLAIVLTAILTMLGHAPATPLRAEPAEHGEGPSKER